MIEPVRGAIRHRFVDCVEDLRAHVATVEVDRFRAFPGRSGNLRIRDRHHTGMVIQGRRADHNDIRIRTRGPARSVSVLTRVSLACLIVVCELDMLAGCGEQRLGGFQHGVQFGPGEAVVDRAALGAAGDQAGFLRLVTWEEMLVGEPPSSAARSVMRRSPSCRVSRMASRVGSARVRNSLAACCASVVRYPGLAGMRSR